MTDETILEQTHNNRISRFMADAVKFVAVFATPIAQSVPQIYLSAIVFAPTESVTAETFHGKYMNTVSVQSGKMANWPAIQNIFHGHSSGVISVAFSRDGSRIVSGSWDNTIPLWDAETGHPIGKPLEGHSSRVESVAFSPDGSRIVSGSLDNTIRLWDAKVSDIVSTSSWPGFFQLLPSGWVVDSDAEKLLWVPPWNRVGLCFPRNTITISRDGATILDFSRFVHGKAWEKCRTG